MITFTIHVTEQKPGTCSVDMKIDGADTASHLETEIAKGIDVGVRQATQFIVQATKDCKAEMIEGRDIEQFVKAALEREKR